jgi:diguanylate cyclase (GGDEF)-like protein
MTRESIQKQTPGQKLLRKAALFHPDKVMFEQLQPLFDGGASTLLANAVVAVILAAVIRSSEQAHVALDWAVNCLVIVACSAITLIVVKRHFNRPEHLKLASRVMTLASALRGVTWGLGFAMLMPKADSYEQVMLGWMLAGLMCGGAFSAWSHPASAMAFALFTGVGGFIGMRGVPDIGESWMPYATLVFFLFLMRCIISSVQVFRTSVLAEKELAAKNGVIGLLLKDFEENASDWLWEADARGLLTRGSERFARMLEVSPEKISSRSLPVISEIHGRDESSNAIFRSKFKAGESFSNQVIGLVSGGMDRYLKISAKPTFTDDQTVAGWHGVASDVTDERLADMKVRKLALFDTLTDLPNRAFFYDRLDTVLCSSSKATSWVMYLDLDGFKSINDTYGHAAGDQLLRAVASRLGSCMPTKGMLARLGGDEFSVICSGSRNRVDMLAKQILEATELSFLLGSNDVTVGVSIGIAQVGEEIKTPDELMRRADVALYAAKNQGRGNARHYDEELDRVQLRRKDIETGLRKALAQELFVLHYQPIVEMQSGEVHSYEALLRLETPELGKVAPIDFIPVAEECGLISDIGDWVIRRACKDAMQWPEKLCVAVNVSPLQLKSHRILTVVTQALAESGLLPSRLELELTESALIDNIEHTTKILADLKALGVRLALDDFGTGYSSLAHLHQFNFDKIKIDRSFVQSFGDRRESTAVVNAVVHLARDLGITMTAEGVETAAHMEAMREVGCDHVQGYLLGRPEAQPEGTILPTQNNHKLA